MNKRISIVLVLSILCSLFAIPAKAAWSAEAPEYDSEADAYIITKPEELVFFSAAVNMGYTAINAVLQNDIDLRGEAWTPIASTSGNAYAGVFDGNGYSVSGLSASSASDSYTGLFGYIAQNGTIKNLTLSGTLTNSCSSGYLGAVAGYNAGTIESCVSNVSISGKNYVGGIAGYNAGTITLCINNGDISSISGYSYTGGVAGIAGYNTGVISYSANSADVYNANNSYGYYTGGIAGRVSGSMQIVGVYNRGDVAGYNNVGGIVGSAEGSGNIKYSYSTGNVTCKYTYSSAYKGGIAGRTGSGMCEYVYFLQTDVINNNLKAVGSGSAPYAEAKSEQELKSASILPLLGGAFEQDLEPAINNGYPILKWQNPDSVYKIELTVTPENSAVRLVNSENEEISGISEIVGNAAVYTYSGLDKGDYVCTVSQEADDYAGQTKNISIAAADIYQSIKLEKRKHNALFSLTPADASFELKHNQTVLTPAGQNSNVYLYSLENGEYTYSASLFGYADLSGTVSVNREDVGEYVTLTRLPYSTVTFNLTDGEKTLDNIKVQLLCGDYEVTGEEDGSYLLPEGSYDYIIKKSGYAKVSDSFIITSEDTGSTKTINAETYPQSAWDGEYDEPPYADGAWQISTGNELAWFAGFVNGAFKSSVSGAGQDAVLLADIDLGGEISWTPIGAGTSYSQTYSGTFDANNKTVSGLYINASKTYQGLFGKTASGSLIKNLTVEGTVASSSYYIGGICAYNQGTILRCTNNANVVGNDNYAGGICGYSYYGTISDCINNGNVIYTSGTGQYKGGICGYAFYTGITQCANTGIVKANGLYAGGLVGRVYSGTTISDCYNTGTVSSNAYSAGGLAGATYGSNSNIIIENCYNTGAVINSPGNCGALIGVYDGGTISNCYCLIENGGINSGLPAVGSGTASDGAVTTVTYNDSIKDIYEALNVNDT